MTAYLIKNGVPFDVAHSLGSAEKLAYCVSFGEIDGGHFNWASMNWIKRD